MTFLGKVLEAFCFTALVYVVHQLFFGPVEASLPWFIEGSILLAIFVAVITVSYLAWPSVPRVPSGGRSSMTFFGRVALGSFVSVFGYGLAKIFLGPSPAAVPWVVEGLLLILPFGVFIAVSYLLWPATPRACPPESCP